MAETPGLINGQQVYSLYEWRLALALWHWHWDFDYQVDFFGGRHLRGGQVVDFMVHTAPLLTPVYVQGPYWHGGVKSADDLLAQATLINELGGKVNPPKAFDQRHLEDQDSANAAVYREFGEGPGIYRNLS